MDSLESLLFGIFNTTGNEEKVGHSIVGNYEVSTCYTVDQGYETAIWKTGNSWDMIIVQRYETKDEAIEGHSLWIEYCKLNPLGAYSVQTEHAEIFKDGENL